MSQFLSPMIFLKVGHKHKLSYLLQIQLLLGMLMRARLGHSILLLLQLAHSCKEADRHVAIIVLFVACSSLTERTYGVTCESIQENCFFVICATGVEHADGSCRNIVKRSMGFYQLFLRDNEILWKSDIVFLRTELWSEFIVHFLLVTFKKIIWKSMLLRLVFCTLQDDPFIYRKVDFKKSDIWTSQL